MKKELKPFTSVLVLALFFTACAPNESANPTPTIDIIGTTAAQLASVMLTQTAAAATPTLAPATDTPIPQFTETPTIEPQPAETTIPQISGDTACYAGPGSNYALVINISQFELVEVVGISNTPGWYVILDPIYGSQCWVSADFIRFEADFDLSSLTLMYP
ncbi:MAG: hypothetical protein RIR73_1830 [Chloroflexota bacterium]